MPPFTLTLSQQKALDDQRNIAVTASAGSGKTATLVSRYLRLLENPEVGMRNVLAITFTEKAAAEMRERIGDRIMEELAQTSDPDRRAHLSVLRDDLNGAHLSTIHAFCAALLREHPLEAEADPGFAIADEMQRAVLTREAVEGALMEVAENEEDEAREPLAFLLEDWSRSQLTRILSDLLDHRREAAPWMEHYGRMSPQEIAGEWQRWVVAEQREAVEDLLTPSGLLSTLREIIALRPLKNADRDTAGRVIAEMWDAVERLPFDVDPDVAIPSFRTLAKICCTSKGEPYRRLPGNKGNWDPGELDRFRTLFSEVGERLSPHWPVLTEELSAADHRAARIVHALASLFHRALRRYEAAKGHGTVLDFDDLEERALSLLSSHPAIREGLFQRFRYVMVDEFQDTNMLQWRLIEPLVSTEDTMARDKLFIVGDPKQSIYAFRNADVAVFREVKRQIVEANRTAGLGEVSFNGHEGGELPSTPVERWGDVVMGENFRSLAAPVDFVNALFEQLLVETGDPFEVGYDPLVCTKVDREMGGSVTLLLAPEAENSLRSLEGEADLVARRIREMVESERFTVWEDDVLRSAQYGDMALLFRRRAPLPVFEEALRRYGIPFQVSGGLGFYQRQEIRDLGHILQFLANRRDSLSLVGLLRSPYVGLSDEGLLHVSRMEGETLWEPLQRAVKEGILSGDDAEAARHGVERLREWMRWRDRCGLAELIRRILNDTNAWATLCFGDRGAQAAANMEKLLSVARAFEAGGYAALSDFLDHLNLLIAEQEREGEAAVDLEGGDTVHLMTIHASKGLEFPIVFLPELHGSFHAGTDRTVLLDRDYGLGCTAADADANYEMRSTYVRRKIAERNRRKSVAEEKRLFYVAATRARDHLILSGVLDMDKAPPPSLEECTDRMGWVRLGLNLQTSDLRRGEKALHQEGRVHPIEIITSPDQIPVEVPRPVEGDLLYVEARNILETDCGLKETPDSPSSLRTSHSALRTPWVGGTGGPVFSPTRLMTYQACPQVYFYRYVLGLPDQGAMEEEEDTRSQAATFGELVHRMLQEADITLPKADEETWIKRLMVAEGVEGGDDLIRALRDVWTRFRTSPFGVRVLGCTEGRSEVPFLLRVQGGLIEGKMDRLIREEGHWKVVDYKTQPIPPGAANRESERYRLQMGLYTLSLSKLFPEQDRFEALIYFTAVDEVCSLLFTKEELCGIQDMAERMIRMIEEERFDPTPSPERCRFCGFRTEETCSHGG